MDCLSFDRTFRLEDTLEKTVGPYIYRFDPSSFKVIPIKIHIVFNPLSSSLSLNAGLVGQEIKDINWKTYGEQMTLARF